MVTRFGLIRLAVYVNGMSIWRAEARNYSTDGQTVGTYNRSRQYMTRLVAQKPPCNYHVRIGIKIANETSTAALGIDRLWTVVLENVQGNNELADE